MSTSIKKKQVTLIGQLLTPIIALKPFYKKQGCWIKVVQDLKTEKKGRLSVIGKVVKGERQAPTLLRGYRGFVKISAVAASEERAQKRVKSFLNSDYLGSKTNEGFGKVKWLQLFTEDYQSPKPRQHKKLKFRKGLGPNYPKELHRLIRALLLHDFVHTEKHPSKIYEQVTIEDEEIREACLHHHNTLSTNRLHPLIQYYDGLASWISRKKPFVVLSKYDSQNGRINFKKLKKEIEQHQYSAFKLYQFVYQSKDLKRIVESMTYGKNPLRNHLLLMVNLAINDWRSQKLIITKGKFQMVSPSATGNEEKRRTHQSATEAEMHLSPTMSNANS
jgi:hypothetical protein